LIFERSGKLKNIPTREHNWFLEDLAWLSKLWERREREEKKKILTRAQSNLLYEHTPYYHEENDLLLLMPLVMANFDH